MGAAMKAMWALPLLGMLVWTTVQADEKDKPPAETTAGWVKYAKNPVLGGDLGTCFDISVLKEGDTYRMWFSWRPKKSLALVESKDGDRYQMWYTGQARGKSWIGYATSKDGKAWKRESDKPVLAAEHAWEKVA